MMMSADQVAERVEMLNAQVRAAQSRLPMQVPRRRFQSSEDPSEFAITGLAFKPYSEEEKRAISVRTITDTTLYDHGLPRDDGVMSLYLGSYSPSQLCKTCANSGGSMGQCTGHFGLIPLHEPVYHPLWLSTFTIKFLHMVCFFCSWPVREPARVPATTAKAAIVQVLEQPLLPRCSNPECQAACQPIYEGVDVKKETKKERGAGTSSICSIRAFWPSTAVFETPEDEAFARTPFTARRALQILSGIPQAFVTNVLKMQAAPHDLCILQSILVPPTCIRPATVTRSTKSDQDLTRSLVDIVKANATVKLVQQQIELKQEEERQRQQQALAQAQNVALALAQIAQNGQDGPIEISDQELGLARALAQDLVQAPVQDLVQAPVQDLVQAPVQDLVRGLVQDSEPEQEQYWEPDREPDREQHQEPDQEPDQESGPADSRPQEPTKEPNKTRTLGSEAGSKAAETKSGSKAAKQPKARRVRVVPKAKPMASDTGKLLADAVSKLQQTVSAYMDRDVSTRKRRTAGPQRQRQSLVDRFGGGKKGRMRSNMMGRRVNNCARFVIGPDALIDLWELRIPRSVAIETTREEVVGAHNFDEMCRCIRIGTSGIGGAQYVIMTDGTRTNLKNLTPAATERVLQRLTYGCTVHRMLKQSDCVVFNRQPSLSRHSVMGHDVLPDRQGGKNNGRFPPNTCAPYNADFDGAFDLVRLIWCV
jgi:DNA-directed RNA polymerase beta' subunit